MKKLIPLFFLLSLNLFSQEKSDSEILKNTKPSYFIGIWDEKNSEKSLKISKLSYDEIPKDLDFRGTVIEALKWSDYNGDNILIQSLSGQFDWKDYEKNSKQYMLQDKSEIYAYLFIKGKDNESYKLKWRLYDYNECFGVDWFTGFIKSSTTITDLNNNGIAEISMPYILVCRGGLDPGNMKIIMYEGNVKYALRGETMICLGENNSYGGNYKSSENLENQKEFKDFLLNKWRSEKCENGRFN